MKYTPEYLDYVDKKLKDFTELFSSDELIIDYFTYDYDYDNDWALVDFNILKSRVIKDVRIDILNSDNRKKNTTKRMQQDIKLFFADFLTQKQFDNIKQ